jgi:hypothetical protein
VLKEYKATIIAWPLPVKCRQCIAVEQIITMDAVLVMPKKCGWPRGSKNKHKT